MIPPGLSILPEDVEERRRQVEVLTRQGKSAAEIATVLGVTPRTVCRMRRHRGIAKPPPTRLTAEQLARAEELLDDGCSASEAARSIGVCQATIAYHFPGRCWPLDVVSAYANLHRSMGRLLG